MTTIWNGCYDSNWRNLVAPESFAHPAKMSRGLLERIYDHMVERGWLKPGNCVADPFGGVGSTGIVGAYRGFRVVMVELEPRFVALAEANFELHRRKWEVLGVPQPRIIQGDSRRLAEIIGAADGICCSPPYAESDQDYKRGWSFIQVSDPKRTGRQGQADYGSTPGQLGAMPSGDFDAVVKKGLANSPDRDTLPLDTQEPRVDHECNNLGPAGATPAIADLGISPAAADESGMEDTQCLQVGLSISGEPIGPSGEKSHSRETGTNALTVVQSTRCTSTTSKRQRRPVEAGIIPSPTSSRSASVATPRDTQTSGNSVPTCACTAENESCVDLETSANADLLNAENVTFVRKCGNTETGNDYWSAVCQIYRECLKVLNPGGVAAIVVKSYCKQGKIVDLPDQTWRLLQAVGFEPVERIQASLVKRRKHAGLFGDIDETTERKSFFRRLAEKRGSPRIDFEEVLFVRKSAGNGGGVDCVVTSPPYAETDIAAKRDGTSYGDDFAKTGKSPRALKQMENERYSFTPGQLGAMKSGNFEETLTNEGVSNGM